MTPAPRTDEEAGRGAGRGPPPLRTARLGLPRDGRAIAEDRMIAPKPATLSFGEAATLSFGGNTALSVLRGGDNLVSTTAP